MSSCPFTQSSHNRQGQSRLQRERDLQGSESSITLVPALSPHTTTLSAPGSVQGKTRSPRS